MVGDFNFLLRSEDKQGGYQVRVGQLSELQSMVNDCGLILLDSSNYNLSWTNKRAGDSHIKEKIDWLFINEKF